ncbi:flavin reductase family protein [candidate division KSB1 bacterium]|nr:flavin reductase family protein [candidate division KSB1 bacterium]
MYDYVRRKRMQWETIPQSSFTTKIFDLWDRQWFILTAGDSKEYNAMTVAWGSLGIMWQKPFAQVVVRPTRHTYQFMEKYDTFTLSAFPEKYRDKLQYLGRASGRDEDKITISGLSPKPSTIINAPGFHEAHLILECKKIYWQDMDANQFLDDRINKLYPKKDFHRIYFGEILTILQKK